MRRHKKRRGALSVEFALTLPIVIVLFFGAYDFSRLNMLLHSIDNAAYEGCRIGLVPGASESEVRTEVERLLKIVGAQNAAIEISPETIDLETEEVTVDISLPFDANGYLAPQFIGGRYAKASCTLKTEQSLFNSD